MRRYLSILIVGSAALFAAGCGQTPLEPSSAPAIAGPSFSGYLVSLGAKCEVATDPTCTGTSSTGGVLAPVQSDSSSIVISSAP